MYKSFYKLNKKPFETKTDPSFLWLGEKHKEALATLRYGILNNMGFLLLTGDVGTGKTTLINALTESLPGNVIYAYISDPNFESLDFYNYIAFCLKIKVEIKSKSDFLIIFKRFLLKASQANKKILLIIDEAQLLSHELIEQIRLLSNMDRGETDILNIFFIGQPEFNETLLKEENRAVRQRISLNYNIKPFNRKETKKYINYRLKFAGVTHDIFSNSAIKKIHSSSGGFPRRINIICDHCLLSGFVKDKTIITKKIAAECIKELSLPRESPTGKTFKLKFQTSPGFKKFVFLSAVLIFFSLIFFGSLNMDSLKGFFPKPILNTNIQSKVLEKDKEIKVLSEIETTNDSNLEKTAPLETEPIIINELDNSLPLKENIEEPEKELVKTQEDKEELLEQKEVLPKLPPFEEKTFTLRFKNNTNYFEDSEFSKFQECAEELKKYPNSKALVSGHTDSTGYSQYNMKLSEFRANMIKGYLIGSGVNPERIEIKAMGDKKPLEKNSTPWGRKMNRRVEIFIYQNPN
ncbi:MAG: AAA family ATPase [Desulforegulaceae bacterium]|nr:AAA family ATPase [Desulforegulaceae bacterium]